MSTALRRGEIFPGGWHRWFLKTVDAQGTLVALVGCQPNHDQTQGWLWGPWSLPDFPTKECVHPLLEEAVRALPSSMRQLDAFLHAENSAGLSALKSAGFTLRQATHIYTASPVADKDRPRLAIKAQPLDSPLLKEGLPFLRAVHEVGFVHLHSASFPPSSQTGDQLLAGRDVDHVILAAVDGLRILGYICLSVNYVPHEGFIDYMAVKPSARGRGVGRWLLAQGLRWIFEERRLPQAALCVTDWREGAQRLYERAGFRLNATGVGARRYLGHRR